MQFVYGATWGRGAWRTALRKYAGGFASKGAVCAVVMCVTVVGGATEGQAQDPAYTQEFDIHRDGGNVHLGSAYQLPQKAMSIRAGVLYPRTGLSRLDENLTFGRLGIAWGGN